MRPTLLFFLFLLFALLATGCGFTPAVGMPIANAPATPTSLRIYVDAPPDATATPTPFQPLAPTAIYLPTETPLPTPTATPIPPTPTQQPTLSLPGQQAVITQPSHQMNVLLLGSDQRPWDGNFRTDTIILATINPELGTINLTSFPRDLYIQIPGWGMGRINTAYTFGGYDLLAQTFEYNFGVTPDHYVLINFSSFKQVVESLGGLDVEVSQTVSDYRAGYWVTVPAGLIHMDADDVLWYVRTRKTTNDFARTRRQQEVISAMFDKFLSMDALKKAPEFYNIYKDNVTTDVSLGDILPLLPMAAKITDRSHIHHYFIGPEQAYDWITWDGAMVLVPRQDLVMQVIREALNNP